jgi:SAM-dependent methyltransferase
MSSARELLKEIERYQQPGKILDIGAAGGHYLKAAQERGWETFGVELSPYATSWANENLGLEIFTGILEEANFPDDFFDVIIMSHTLEHLSEPLGTLRKACQILKNNGLIYINVPNVSLLKTQIKKRGKLGALREEEHLFWFSLKTLKAMLGKAGFKIFKVRRGPSLSAEVLANIGISAVDISKARHFVNKYFSYPKEILREFIGKIIPGGGIIIYAKKEK